MKQTNDRAKSIRAGSNYFKRSVSYNQKDGLLDNAGPPKACFDKTHIFHLDCLTNWLDENIRCPVCNLGVTDELTNAETMRLLQSSDNNDLVKLFKLISERENLGSSVV